MKLAFHPEAAHEFEEAVKFYRQRGRHLGKRFAHELRVAIAKIEATPQRWMVLEQDIRRCPVHVFPYVVLYTIETDCLLVVAIMHGKRQPGYWRNRLKRRF